MMTRVVICCIFIFIFGNLCVADNVIKNKKYESCVFKFEPLDDDEILSYIWDNSLIENKGYTITLFAENKHTKQRRPISYWDAPYAGYQFSSDRKIAIIFLNTKTRNRPFFYLDGINGTIKYLFDIDMSVMSDRDLNYLLWISESLESSAKKFSLIDLHSLKVIKIFEWQVYPRRGGGPRIFRSMDPKYDFRIDYNVEDDLYAVCYYNIEFDCLVEIFNDTKLIDKNGFLYERELKRQPVLLEEIGLY
jgi:hypothetical protein